MAGKKSILFVMNTMGRAGAERALIEMLRALDPARYSIYLYVLIPRGELFQEVPPYVRVINRRTDSRSVLSAGGKAYVAGRLAKSAVRGGSLIKAVMRLKDRKKTGDKEADAQSSEKILRRLLADGTPAIPGRYDLAVAYLEGPATWYVAEKVRADKKAAFLHVDYARAGYTEELDGGCYGVFSRIYAVSKDVRDGFLKVYPGYADKTRIFFNILDKEHIRRRALEPGGFSDGYKGLRLLSVGRLYPQKGYDTAVKTAAILKERGLDFRWYVLGEGGERKNIAGWIRQYGLEDTFYLLGAADNPYPYFAGADIYVCTSRYEGKSIVIEEAQALGLPVVATGCTGVTEQVRRGVDGEVAGMDACGLAGAIEKLIKDPVLRAAYADAAYQKEPSHGDGMGDLLSLFGSDPV